MYKYLIHNNNYLNTHIIENFIITSTDIIDYFITSRGMQKF